MATTSPEQVRAGLGLVAAAAAADMTAAVPQAPPERVRALLFDLAPMLLAEYGTAAAVLAADWHDELRADSGARKPFTATPRFIVDAQRVAAMVAATTETLRDLQTLEREFEVELAQAVKDMTAELEHEIAAAMRDTVVLNSREDPESVGWRRFARPEACKFCLMLAARGAVYTAETARFAAHGAVMAGKRKGGNCMCIAGPAFGGKEIWAEATPMQYVASKRRRSAKERAALRAYLAKHFPDAPG